MTVAAEIDQIISLLEAEIPANINSPQNQRLEGKLQRKLAKYFRALGTAFPYQKIDKIYNRYVRESLGSETEGILDSLLRFFASGFATMIEGELAEIYLSGTAEMMTWGMTKSGLPIAYEGPPIKRAVDFAKKRGAKLVTQMDEETKRRLSRVISDGIKNKRGIPGLTTDIKRELGWMGRGRPSEIKGLTMQGRARMIARTETNDALSQASLDKMRDMDITGKEWLWPGGECGICASNASDGVIPREQSFSSGDMRPPAHPNCVCSLAPAMLKK